MTLDVICVIDPRFAGGTAAAMKVDVEAFLAADLSVGLIEVRSSYLKDVTDQRSPVISELCKDNRLRVLDDHSEQRHRARAVFLHHPMTFFYGIRPKIKLDAERSFLVAHHLPFRGDGSLQYDPVVTTRRAHMATGLRPLWAPVSGICRQQLQSFSPLIQIAHENWPNVFDVRDWEPQREAFSGDTLTIGRHGRPDMLKWPKSKVDIAASLPRLPDTSVRVMGAPTAALANAGVDTSDWTILPFNAEPVKDFLDQLDVFIYHFHPESSESFGRTVAEAMLMGAACILDPRLEPTFGDLAIYCAPEQTASVIDRLRQDPVSARKSIERARAAVAKSYGVGSVAGRLSDLMQDNPPSNHDKVRFESPFKTFRKTVGMMRRREYFLSDLNSGSED